MRTIIKGLLAIAVAAGFSASAAAELVAISTLPPGAINNVQAQVVAKVVQENSDLQMRVVTFNSPTAIIGAVQNKQADFAFTSNDEAGTAVRGTEDHAGKPMKDLRIALTVFPFAVGIMVQKDSDIRSIKDMKGRKYATGWQGFKQGIALSNGLLANGGLSLADINAVPATNLLRAADDFKAGKTDGAMFAIGAPKVAEIHSAIGGLRFISLENTPEALARMQAVRPEYHLTVRNPAPHLPGLEGPTVLMEYYIVIMTNAGVSDQTVYKLVKALHDNKDGLAKGHPSFRAFDPAGIGVAHQGMPYHPGALKYFKEAGVASAN